MNRWVTGERAEMELEDIHRELFELCERWMPSTAFVVETPRKQLTEQSETPQQRLRRASGGDGFS